MSEWFLLEEWIHTDREEDSRECCFEEREEMLEGIGSNRAMLDWREGDGWDWGVEEGLTTWFSSDLTSCNDLIGRVGFFFFFDRMMRMMMTRIMTMRRTRRREMRMIVRVDRALTVKDSWVWMNPSWLEAWIVIDVDGNVDEGIPEMIPVDWLRERPGGRVPEVIVNRGLSPEMIGEIENDCPLMRVNESWE